MQMKPYLLAMFLVTSLVVWGCNGSTAPTENGEHADHDGHAAHDDHAGHDHGDQPLWMERLNQELGDTLVSLGFHGEQPHAGEPLEVAATVTRDDAMVEDAIVTASIVDAQGNVIAEEVALAFHPAHGGDEAHYDTEDTLMVPEDAATITIRYIVTLADGTSETYDVNVSVLHHD